MAYHGTVKWFSQARGYGFIQGDNGYEYFVHIEAISGDGFQYLDEGDRVRFNVRRPLEHARGKAWRAVNVELIDDPCVDSTPPALPTFAPEAAPQTSDSALATAAPSVETITAPEENSTVRHRKRNPFDRLPATDPARFVGRETEIRTAIEFLSDYKNLIVSGAIGVGKSSLLHQIREVLSNNQEAIAKYSVTDLAPVEIIAVVRHQCEDDNTLDHIRAGLISQLRRDFLEGGANGLIKEGLKTIKSSIRWFMSGRVTVEKEDSAEESAGEQASQNKFFQFVEDLLRDRQRVGNIAGIVFVIDEVERLGEDVMLGPFVKAAGEHFNNRKLKNIAFVLCGAEGTASRIYAQQPRLRQVLEHLPLPGMSDIELGDIIATNLREAEASIDNEAASIIVRLANRNPSRLIFLAGSAYEQDDDGIITRADVDKAARKLISNLVKADFRNIIERKSWESTYKIMECVSDHEGTPLTAEIIAGATGLELNSTESFCGILAAEEIFVSLDNKSEDRKKKYAFRDPIFALYFKLAHEMGIRFEKERGSSEPDPLTPGPGQNPANQNLGVRPAA